ncbi:hypothetical protein BC936DRAFT_139826 [Jimgerdemannia flammicorona]|uniref:DUF1479-domain-containing protein n=1 Tax=Jimgerdemannia flammicorona TaxID=994334 RepID=A0A433B968_9FUNG|nr:hypothetical protein BC936DRAFT_139826 [Jimgerdemannia flammicorona]
MQSMQSDNEHIGQDAAIRKVKREICPDPDTINAAWARLLVAIEREAKEIKEKGFGICPIPPQIIPQLDFADLHANQGHIPAAIALEVRRRGVLVIHNVITAAEVQEYKTSVVEYLERNRERTPAAYAGSVFKPAFYSKAQTCARQHENMVEVVRAMNRLWHGGEGKSGSLGKIFSLGRMLIQVASIDGSMKSTARFTRKSLRARYVRCHYNVVLHSKRDIFNPHLLSFCFSTQWEDHDPFDITHRLDCVLPTNKFFRSFQVSLPPPIPILLLDPYSHTYNPSLIQGWLSLSHCSPGEGSLRVCPMLPLQIAYYMMRPFVAAFPDDAWPGVHGQHFDNQRRFEEMLECFVSVPSVGPGDVVFWHCDLAHAVEPHHTGTSDSTVFYIPAAPLCELNARYAREARESFLRGVKGPDFVGRDGGDEGPEVAFEDRAGLEDLSEVGRRLMGFEPWEGEEEVVRRCAEIVRA